VHIGDTDIGREALPTEQDDLIDKLPTDVEKSTRRVSGCLTDMTNLINIVSLIVEEEKPVLDEINDKLDQIIEKLDSIGSSSARTVCPASPARTVCPASPASPARTVCTASTVKKVRKSIPKKVREAVWKKRNGDSFVGKCFCCDCDLRFEDFEVGHVVSVAEGGDDNIDNLEPVCRSCNRSMSKKNMLKFKKTYLDTSTTTEA